MTFAPFAVECLTCGSRLKVTNPALVGTIASCPKCNSMVEVQPPAPTRQLAVGDSSVDSQALTEDSINVDTDDLDASSAPSGFVGDVPEQAHEPLPGAPMPPGWQSEKTQRSRQIGLIVAISATSLLGAVLVFGWFIRSWRKQADVAQNQTQEDTQALQDQPTVEDVEGDAEPTTDVETPDADPIPTENDPPKASTDDLDPMPAPEEKPDQPKTPIPGPEPNNTSDLITGSPLDDLLAPEKTPAKADADESKLESLPPGLAEIAEVVGLDTKPIQPNLEPLPTEIELVGPAPVEIDPNLVANPPEKINLVRALGAVKFAIDTKNNKYPLADITLVISQLTGVPIQIDWVAFDLMGKDIRQPIVLPERKLYSAGDFLAELAKSYGAEIEKTDNMVILKPTKENQQLAFANLFDLTDFADPDSAAILLNQFLHGPDTSSNKLQVDEEDSDQYKLAALATEALRRMRSTKPKIAEQPFRRWAQSLADPNLDWPIITNGVSIPQLDAPIAMTGLLRRIAKGNKVSCVINWFDGVQFRMSPKQLTLPHAQEAGDVLKAVLDPFKLQVRQVDTDFWWVSTAATYDRFPVVVWTEPLGANPEQKLKEIVSLVLKSEKAISNVAIDPSSNRALLLLPRYIVRQLPKLHGTLTSVNAKNP